MIRLFNLFYSHSGCVGRSTWWWMQLLILPLAGVLVLSAMFTSEKITHYSSPQWMKKDAYLQSLPIPERNKVKRDTLSEDSTLFALQISAILLLAWAQICIDVKRWHDLGMSGYWICLRIVPGLARSFFGPTVGVVASVILWLATLYFLGFRPGIYDDVPEMRNPPQSKWVFVKNLTGVIVLVALIVFGVRHGVLPSNQTLDTAPDLSDPGSGN